MGALAASGRASTAPDRWTVIALAVLAGACATLLHEGLGHGGACMLSGGHNLVISSVNENCTATNRWIDAAGTLVNLAAGAVCWEWMRQVGRAVRFRYFLWLLMSFNLLTGAGYFLFSGIGGLGDWAAVVAGLQPAWLWRAGMAVGGGVLYVLVLRVILAELVPFLPSGPERMARAWTLMVVPYFTYGILEVVAGLFNPVGPILIAESAAAASFGGVSGLWWGREWLRSARYNQAGGKLAPLGRSRAWILGGAVAAAGFIAIVGPGIR